MCLAGGRVGGTNNFNTAVGSIILSSTLLSIVVANVVSILSIKLVGSAHLAELRLPKYKGVLK